MSIINTSGEIVKAGCLVVDARGNVLLVHDSQRGTLGLPKGHLEPHETLEQAAIRETREETGYEVTLSDRLPDLTYLHGETNQPIRVAIFLAAPAAKISENTDEVFEWYSPDEAAALVKDNVAAYLRTIPQS